jgi:poly(glycerol-phosphate) alpha-glucosyltransferase
MVVKKLPDARLEIYGFGALRQEYREQIDRLGLANNVFLMGATDDPAAVFSGAALSMMTSAAEGFGITLVESICNGCPAIAFDIKYGPSDIIADGDPGFLITMFDKGAYANRIIAYLWDTELQRAMSENCYADAARFNPEAFARSWFELTKRIYSI